MRANLQMNLEITHLAHITEIGEIAKAAGYWGYGLLMSAPQDGDEGYRTAHLVAAEQLPLNQELVRLMILHTVATGQSIDDALDGLAEEVKVEARGYEFDRPLSDQEPFGEGKPKG
jgi:hypothetical protein